MPETWGNLKKEEVAALRLRARTMSEAEQAVRFQKRDNRTTFRILRKTDRAVAGQLDIDITHIPLGYEVAEVTLISPGDFDYTPQLTDADHKAAKPIEDRLAQFSAYFAADPGLLRRAGDPVEAQPADLPAVVDHRPNQSPVKDQGDRGTCVAHASMGLIEAFGHIPDDLSEQYAHYKFNVFLGQPQNQDSGLKTTDSAPFLARNDGRVCLESQWPYIAHQATVNAQVAAGTYAPPAAAVANQTYGIGAYKIIEDKGAAGESIKNTRYLEALLYQGYNVVVGVWVSWDDKDNNGILEPVLDPSGKPVGQGGHAMVIVGYNRPGQYFIVKNSWKNTWGHDGYAYLHYDFFRSCAKYGYVVDTVVPAAPPNPLPSKLANAPFNTTKISRAALRAGVVFFKTSQGRFAVSEVYAGDNLYLRNLRVYNANGSMHLTRDSLVIRGTYLCDLDTGKETANDADFWWEAVSSGVNFLVPRNGARAWVAYDLAALTPQQIGAMSFNSSPVASKNLNYAVIAGKTTTGRTFKILAQAEANNKLELSYVEVFNPDGSRYRYQTEVQVASSWTYDLDALAQGGGANADLWWHVISDNVGFLEAYNTAKTRLVWLL